MAQKPCYALNCDEKIPSGLLMCRRHWAMVPRDIQAIVYSTYRNWKAGASPRPYVVATLRAQLAVAKAQDFPPYAIAALEGEIAEAQKGGQL